MNKITPEEFAYYIYNMSTQEAEDFFKDVKSVLKEKSQQEVEEVRKQLEQVNKALDASIERKKKLNKLSKKM